MARKRQSQGSCMYCGKEMSKGGISRHLKSCSARQDAMADAAGDKEQALYHLQVQDAERGDYWLHLEMSGNATLQQLDKYLRAIWLECCGHLSTFFIGGAWSGMEVAMNRQIDRVFDMTDVLDHIYDFGASSETKIKYVGKRKGVPLTKHPIALMARNVIPAAPCQECGQPAAWLCTECIYEHDMSGFLCDEHGQAHPHDDYGGVMVYVNSPRVGMCGYAGPAEPPY
ncbi:MAG: hypothetical protein H6645_07955 [Caldilineaceae bacterium]|nr:hypothetical protein [Caldilineaceae bacterium]